MIDAALLLVMGVLYAVGVYLILEKADDVGGVDLRTGLVRGAVIGLLAGAEAAQIRCDELEAASEAPHHRLPGQPEFRPTVQQHQRAAVPEPRHVEGDAVRRDRVVPDCRRVHRFRPCRRRVGALGGVNAGGGR